MEIGMRTSLSLRAKRINRRVFSAALIFFFVSPAAFAITQQWSPSIAANMAKPVSVDLRNIDAVDILKFLAAKASLNIITSKDVTTRRVTLMVKNVTIADAMEVILLSSNLAAYEKRGILQVMTEEEYTAMYGQSYRDQRNVKIVSIRYTDPEKVGQILEGVRSALGKIIIDKQTGNLFLIDIPEKLSLMEKMIQAVDIPTVERIVPTENAVFELSYQKAADLETQLRPLLSKGIGAMNLDVKSNRIVVDDLPYKVMKIRDMIKAFDQKTREVFIETKMLQIRLNNTYQSGINWEYIVDEGVERKKFKIDTTGTLALPSTAAGASKGAKIILGDLGKKDMLTTINMLHQFGDTKTLASPQITVEHGKEASINVGTREAYVTSTVSQATGSTTTSESITFVDVGVQLKVTPMINQDGYISMQIHPEVSSVGRTLDTSNGNAIPIVSTTNATTQVTVKDGHTVLIGGL
ncbi:MAG: hypothetical protein EXS63_06830, partial [Candidatus Omnitrophica bacterium]|nr:hypothetical protein [Candidatus Omnitrophota bacterium]